MDEAGFTFLSEDSAKRDSGETYTKLLFFRELEVAEFVFVTIVETRFCEDWFEVALSRLKKLATSLGPEDEHRIARKFENKHKPPMEVLEEVIEFADLIASYDAAP